MSSTDDTRTIAAEGLSARDRRLRLGGIPTAVLEAGDGPPVVLLHGPVANGLHWRRVIPRLSAHHRVVAPDLPGQGETGQTAGGTREEVLEWLDALVDQTCDGPAALVGVTVGGAVAAWYAAKHPERMAGLVIVDIGPEHDPRGTTRIRMEVMQRGDGSFSAPAEYERVLAHNFPAGSPEALARMARHELRQRADGRFERKADPAFMAGRPGQDEAEAEARERDTAKRLWDALARIPCPTLVVRGAASDILSPEIADRMVDDVLANGRLAVVPRAAHSVMTDNPAG